MALRNAFSELATETTANNVSVFTQNDILEKLTLIHKEMKIMNTHLRVITGLNIEEEEEI